MKNDVGEEAREVICNLQKDRNGNIALKTNQIRKFLTAVNAITNKIQVYKAKNLKSHTLPDELAAEVSFLKVKAAYQAGREKNSGGPINQFVRDAHIMEYVDEIGSSIDQYEKFAHYIEALVAYHKYYGGKD
ncbi:type III-A CRISPR-associated protein Csm2 [uncultured Megasphaera sp.]|uniref:type III-A CRISPR-associated protein Csm2 n=1 Tax=uncultured Megasphaera sp. TaxID=165188 RepID=UPI0025D84E9D|nr:type III-A CRISPR-associated protein Csm2 [uncultured Megasphaera sp.]